jgi:pimeloyl-ACP methyl ester carboxylesterase
MATAHLTHHGGIDIHYELTDFTDPWRASETVLLHHGFGRNMNFWREWVPLLARHYRVLRVDARGCGQSAVPPRGAPYTLDLLMQDAVGVMDHLGIARVHWGAEASGGHVGLAVALAHPDRIASVTLCNTPFQLPQSANDNFSEAEVEQLGLGYWARKTLPNRIDLDKVTHEWMEWSIAEHDKTPRHIAIAQHAMIAQGNLLPRLPEVKAPVLVMAGSHSKIAPKEQMIQMQRALPNAKLVLFEGYSQGIAFSAPERCVGEMRTFLQNLA